MLNRFCKYFANAKNPREAFFDDLEIDGFSIYFKDNNSKEFKQVKVLFNSKVLTEKDLIQQLELLKKEVDSVLNLVFC